ncbi:MAG: ABC transporter ATP-binding protein [Candidatus Eisenbacteria bacterium]|uniref:ABC transporter ATP-binding protein n=1 Tax=Eiseniibacteriota bacterium TaxID=2212470 RepID=A0A538UAZ6_UNCEI|nr:MAG: ABC transporter ATP-binding protein [Candidatus Eisenbacteria bacterium]
MLTLTEVGKSYGATLALESVSLEIRPGEVFGLLGPNGAGKSTTVALAVGLLDPDRGRVEIAGRGAPRDPRVRRSIGVAPQALALYEELTAEENLRFFGAIQGLQGAALTERTRWALEFVGLTGRARDRAVTYSGGMKRRLNLAIAVVHDPPLLLLDEPTVGVDPQSRNAIFENILALKRRGRTILYTTHYMEEAQRLCDRVAVLDHGRILALDRVPDLIAAHGGRSALVLEGNGGETRLETDDPIAELSRLLQDGGLPRFRLERPDLEAVFLNLTGRHLRD